MHIKTRKEKSVGILLSIIGQWTWALQEIQYTDNVQIFGQRFFLRNCVDPKKGASSNVLPRAAQKKCIGHHLGRMQTQKRLFQKWGYMIVT